MLSGVSFLKSVKKQRWLWNGIFWGSQIPFRVKFPKYPQSRGWGFGIFDAEKTPENPQVKFTKYPRSREWEFGIFDAEKSPSKSGDFYFGDWGFFKSEDFYPRGVGIFWNLRDLYTEDRGFFGDGDFFSWDGIFHEKATSGQKGSELASLSVFFSKLSSVFLFLNSDLT